MTRHFLVVAAGSGSRFGATLPKQFTVVAGLPLLMHTLHALTAGLVYNRLVLVLPSAFLDYWADLCEKHAFSLPHTCVAGGDTRFESVRKGLDCIPDDGGFTAVHDGVRPLTGRSLPERLFRDAAEFGSAIPVVPVTDSLRVISGDKNDAVDRGTFLRVQTPQVFLTSVLKEAYRQGFRDSYTDDAVVVENLGYPIHLSEGLPDNIKVTTLSDLLFAEAVLSRKEV